MADPKPYQLFLNDTYIMAHNLTTTTTTTAATTTESSLGEMWERKKFMNVGSQQSGLAF